CGCSAGTDRRAALCAPRQGLAGDDSRAVRRRGALRPDEGPARPREPSVGSRRGGGVRARHGPRGRYGARFSRGDRSRPNRRRVGTRHGFISHRRRREVAVAARDKARITLFMAQGSLPGFRDFYPEQFAERAHVMNVCPDVARRFAFAEYDGPPLEPLELYTKKSGDEIVGQLYNFTDKCGRAMSIPPQINATV